MSLESWGITGSQWAANEAIALRDEVSGVANAGLPVDGARAAEMVALAVELDDNLGNEWERTRSYNWPLPDGVPEKIGKLREYAAGTSELRRQAAVRQGERTRPYSMHPHEALVKEVDRIASDAYTAYARVSGIRPDQMRQQPGSNYAMALVLRHELRKHGIEMAHRIFHRAGEFYHFLETPETGNGDKLYLDPTWQSMLPKDTDYTKHPNVLIAPSDRMVDTAASHGVTEPWHCVWQETKDDTWEPALYDDWWRWEPWLARLFAAEPYHWPIPLREQRTWE